MKKVIILLFAQLSLIVLLSMSSACAGKKHVLSKSNTGNKEIQSKSPNMDFNSFNLPFPNGTTFEFEGSTLNFTLPQSHYIVGIDKNGNYYKSMPGGSGSVTCECTDGTGCDPIKSKGEYGCLMTDGCSNCHKSTSSISGVKDNLVEIVIFKSDYFMFIDSFSQLDNQYLLPHSFIDYPEVVSFLTDLQSDFLKSNTNDTKIVFINAYGYILPIEVPADIDNTSLFFVNSSDRGEICSCNVGGKCPRKSKLIVVWCDSKNCTSCTMSGIIANENGEKKLFSENRGKINID